MHSDPCKAAPKALRTPWEIPSCWENQGTTTPTPQCPASPRGFVQLETPWSHQVDKAMENSLDFSQVSLTTSNLKGLLHLCSFCLSHTRTAADVQGLFMRGTRKIWLLVSVGFTVSPQSYNSFLLEDQKMNNLHFLCFEHAKQARFREGKI